VNNWTTFADLFANFNAPFLTAVNQLSGNLSSAVAVPATLLATFYIAFGAYQDLYSDLSGNPVLNLVRRCLRVALILSCLVSATYVGTVSNVLLNTLPTDLAQAVTGGPAAGAAAFDTLIGQAWGATEQVYKNLSAFNAKSIVLGIFASLYLVLAAPAIVVAFAVWLITQVGLGLLVAIGPLAIACLIMPQTARFFNGWLASVMTGIVAQLMIVTIAAVLVAVVKNTLTQILTADAAAGVSADSLGGQVHHLVNALVMFLLAAIMSVSVIPIARAIGGGAAAETSGVVRWASGAIGSAAGAAGSAASAVPAAAAAAARGAGDAGMRAIKIAGKAL
jgi:type IV secretion system protein VirB6